MAEILVLDPVEEAPDRTEFDLTPFIADQGPDYGEAGFEPYKAQLTYGELPVDFRLPNRVVTVPLLLLDREGKEFEEVRAAVQAKAALFQARGGWLKRETAVGPVFTQIVGATLKLGGSTMQALYGIDADAVLTLECLPVWHEPWEELPGLSNSAGDGEWIGLIEGHRGDVPAPVRLEVTDQSSAIQRGLLAALYYQQDPVPATAQTAYEAEDLTPLQASVGTQGGASPAGSISNNAVVSSGLSTGWSPVLSTEIDGVGHMTHTDTVRVFARAYSQVAGTTPRLRLVADVGDLTLPRENAPWQFPSSGDFFIADLGQVQLYPAPVGERRWTGQIQGQSIAGQDIASVAIDKIWLIPIDNSFMRLRAPVTVSRGLGPYAALDEFNQSPGNLTGKSAAIGGAYSALTGSDANDFTVNSTARLAQRTATSDTGTLKSGFFPGRAVGPDISLTATVAEMSYSYSADVAGPRSGLLVRADSHEDFLVVYVQPWGGPGSSGPSRVHAWCATGGSAQEVGRVDVPSPAHAGTLRVWVIEDRYIVWLNGQQVLAGRVPELATTLNSGGVYLYDEQPLGTAVTRSYDNFAAWAPADDAVIFADQTAELRSDGCFRTSADGAGTGPISHIRDKLPTLPPPGGEGRAVELFVKSTRGDLETLSDAGLDALIVEAEYRPSWLFVRGASQGS